MTTQDAIKTMLLGTKRGTRQGDDFNHEDDTGSVNILVRVGKWVKSCMHPQSMSSNSLQSVGWEAFVAVPGVEVCCNRLVMSAVSAWRHLCQEFVIGILLGLWLMLIEDPSSDGGHRSPYSPWALAS